MFGLHVGDNYQGTSTTTRYAGELFYTLTHQTARRRKPSNRTRHSHPQYHQRDCPHFKLRPDGSPTLDESLDRLLTLEDRDLLRRLNVLLLRGHPRERNTARSRTKGQANCRGIPQRHRRGVVQSISRPSHKRKVRIHGSTTKRIHRALANAMRQRSSSRKGSRTKTSNRHRNGQQALTQHSRRFGNRALNGKTNGGPITTRNGGMNGKRTRPHNNGGLTISNPVLRNGIMSTRPRRRTGTRSGNRRRTLSFISERGKRYPFYIAPQRRTAGANKRSKTIKASSHPPIMHTSTAACIIRLPWRRQHTLHGH